MIEEFKWKMNSTICQRLMESEQQLSLIEQWYEKMIALDRNWKENKQEEERLRKRKEQGLQAFRLNNTEVLRQQLLWSQVWPKR